MTWVSEKKSVKQYLLLLIFSMIDYRYSILSSQVVSLPLQSVMVANFCAANYPLIGQDADNPEGRRVITTNDFFSYLNMCINGGMDESNIGYSERME